MEHLKSTILMTILAVLAPPSGAQEILTRPTLVLGIGEQRLVRAPFLKRYSPSGEAIHATALKEGILVRGQKLGYGDLWIWNSDGSTEHRPIHVSRTEHAPLPPGLERDLSALDEVEVLSAGERMVLRGPIKRLSESARVRMLVSTYPRFILDETELSPELLLDGKNRLQTWLKKSKFAARLNLEETEHGLRLNGSLSQAGDLPFVQKQALALFPALDLAIDTLPDDAPTVHFKVFLLELKKNKFGSFGLSWPGSTPGAFKVSAWGVKESIALDVALHALEGEGSARILSNPELVVRAPGEAELFAGGELPIRTNTHFSSQVNWKSFGLTLKLKVTHVTVEKVRVDISTEVSHLDREISGDQLPGLQANRMKTQVDARFGQPLLLSGLLQQDTREQARGLPWLRQIPILGHLFESEDFLNERSELVAILLPQFNVPDAPMHRLDTERLTPRGPSPWPRNWITPEEERRLRASANFPWNAVP